MRNMTDTLLIAVVEEEEEEVEEEGRIEMARAHGAIRR